MDQHLDEFSDDLDCDIHSAIGQTYTAYISGDDYEREEITYIIIDGDAVTEGTW